MKKYFFLISLIIIILIIIFLFIFVKNISTKNLDTKSNNTVTKSLKVSPQVPRDKVIVNSVTLTKKGFVVVREIEGNHLSQVVEISKPLNSGVHKNIEVPLGGADIKNKLLIVMIYEDYASDGFFNDFDQPMVDEGGHMTGVYLATGKSIPESVSVADPSEMMMDPNMKGMKHVVIVRYTDKGFSPTKVEVPVGSMVQFINESSKQMWVASAPHPAHTDLPTFDQFKPYSKGAVYRYVFDKKGLWGFHDHISPSFGGIISVL